MVHSFPTRRSSDLRKTTGVRSIHTYRGLSPLVCISEAIAASNPDLIIPSDDIAVQHLHDLYESAGSNDAGKAIRELIERSMGPASNFPIAESRSDFINMAREEGIRAPLTKVISDLDQLHEWIGIHGLPVVLKANGTSSGEGVKLAQSLDEAERGFRSLQAPPMFARMAKRVIVDQDARLVRPVLSRKRSTVNAQTYVQGRDATSLIACWKGEVLAALHFEVVQKQYSGGPASVMRVISHPDMCSAAERICRRLKLSGFCGFDFMLEDQTGHAHLIEMNSRPTQVGHLTLGPGRDLVAALCAASTGRALQESATITDKTTIALFPQEWVRNPQSPYLETAYHDIPWQEPALVRACVRSSRDWRRFFSFEKKKWIQVPEADRP